VLGAPPAFVLSQDQTLRRDRSPGPKAGFAVFWSRPTEEAPSADLLTRSAKITERFLLCTVVKPRARRTGLGVTRSLASHAVQFSRCEWTRGPPRKRYLTSRGGRANEMLAAPPQASTGGPCPNACSQETDQSLMPASRANRRRPTCHTEPDIAPGGSPSIGRSSLGCGCPFIRTPP
jgi:hypothetical protein